MCKDALKASVVGGREKQLPPLSIPSMYADTYVYMHCACLCIPTYICTRMYARHMTHVHMYREGEGGERTRMRSDLSGARTRAHFSLLFWYVMRM